MVVTLAGLCQAIPTRLQPVAPVPVPAAAVSGVHVSELPDPTAFLDGGELLLTTGLTLFDQDLPLHAYAARLAAGGVVGLGIGLGPVFDHVPPGLPPACERAGLPLLVVPEHTPFQAVVREFWRQVGTVRESDLQAAVGSAHALVRAALTDDPGAAVVRAIATSVGGWSAVLDPEAAVAHIHPRAAAPRARQAISEITRMRLSAPHSAATFPLGQEDVLVHGLGREGHLDGYLLVARPRPLPTHARHLLVTASALLQLQERWARPSGALPSALPLVLGTLARLGHVGAAGDLGARLGRPTPDRVRVALVRDLPRSHLDRVAAEHVCAPGASADEPTLLVLDDRGAARAWDALRRHGRHGRDGRTGPAADRTGAAADPERATADTTTGDTTTRDTTTGDTTTGAAEPMDRGEGPTGGVLTATGSWADLPRLLTRAEEALVHTPPGTWRDLAAPARRADRAGGLEGLAGLVDGATGLVGLVDEARVEALASYPRADLVATLAAYLRHRGRIDQAAAELGLHRNSMRHRMGIVREILDVDLDDPDVAAAWWLSLRARGSA